MALDTVITEATSGEVNDLRKVEEIEEIEELLVEEISIDGLCGVY